MPPGASGMRDYGELLAGALRDRGALVEQRWVEDDGFSVGGALKAGVDLLRVARSLQPGHIAVWHYSSMSLGYRGIPGPGVLFALAARRRGTRVVTILHEPTYPWGRRGWRGRTQSAAQSLALLPVARGSHALVVTVTARAAWLQRVARRPVNVIPVFCTVPVAGPSAGPVGPRASGCAVGAIAFAGDGARPDVVVDAVARMSRADLRLVLLGAPGGRGPAAAVWRRRAEEAGFAERLEFTGVVPAPELSARLSVCDLVVFANDLGPSSRRTTVAAALAHGVPVIALDGPERWQELVDHGAVALVPARPEPLAAVMSELLGSPPARERLARRGREFYDRTMSIDRVADAWVAVLRPPVQPGS